MMHLQFRKVRVFLRKINSISFSRTSSDAKTKQVQQNFMNKLIPFFMADLIVLSDGVPNLALPFYDLHTDWLDFNSQLGWHKSFVQKATPF